MFSEHQQLIRQSQWKLTQFRWKVERKARMEKAKERKTSRETTGRKKKANRQVMEERLKGQGCHMLQLWQGKPHDQRLPDKDGPEAWRSKQNAILTHKRSVNTEQHIKQSHKRHSICRQPKQVTLITLSRKISLQRNPISEVFDLTKPKDEPNLYVDRARVVWFLDSTSEVGSDETDPGRACQMEWVGFPWACKTILKAVKMFIESALSKADQSSWDLT